MEFKEAFEHLENGKKVRRRAWEDKTIYLMMGAELKCYRQECVVFNYDLSVFDDEWFIIGKEEIYSFSALIPFLLKGNKIKLKHWPEGCFVEADSSKTCLIKHVNCEYDFIPTFGCLAADDWEVIED